MNFPRFETTRVIRRPLSGELRWFIESRRWWRPVWTRANGAQITGYSKKEDALVVAVALTDREVIYINHATIMAERLE